MNKLKKRILGLMLSLALVFSIMPLISASPVLAAGTTSVTVTKLANDGTTVLDQVTVTLAEMMADSSDLPIYGDGTTHYYHQGPVFIDDPDEETEQALRWNPEEDTNVDTKDMGAVRGTNVKDLCDLVGGMSEGEEVKIKAVDGFSKWFAYENVYEYSSREGPMVVCWEKNGMTPETGYNEGMRLVWFADTSVNPWGIHAFGNWDWHEAADSEYWYYYQSGGESYPTTTGLSVQYVSEIIIYSQDPPPSDPDWPLTLEGASIYAMGQAEFEAGAGCHEASWVDGENTWSGIPLWLLVGYVDDGIQHGEGAFNDGLAAAGYDVRVVAFDGYSKVFASADVARNNDMIIANKLNGVELDSDYYPLRLVGPGLTGGQKVSQVVRIELENLPEAPELSSDSLTASALVTIPTLGIALDRESIDYGDVIPGKSSEVETVGITNIGTLTADVTLEVDGVDDTAQSFYEQSLYVDSSLYDIATVIAAALKSDDSKGVATQLQVPGDWSDLGTQEAQFIFWAEASE